MLKVETDAKMFKDGNIHHDDKLKHLMFFVKEGDLVVSIGDIEFQLNKEPTQEIKALLEFKLN